MMPSLTELRDAVADAQGKLRIAEARLTAANAAADPQRLADEDAAAAGALAERLGDDLASAEGKVRVAEARLAEVESETGSKWVAAEEALRAAERAVQRAGSAYAPAAVKQRQTSARAAAMRTRGPREDDAAAAPTPEQIAAEEAVAAAQRAVQRRQDELTAAEAAPAEPAGAAGEGTEDEPEPMFTSVDEWVTEHFVLVYARRLSASSAHWCARWWDHAEAISRLHGCWRAWEVLRLDGGTGIGIWYRDHLDPLLRELLSPEGTFAGCTPDVHEPADPLPCAPAPEGYWQ